MWWDIQRRVEYYSFPVPHGPVSYPLKDFDQANLIGIVMNQDGRYAEYLEQTYRAWFLEGLEAGSEPNIKNVTDKMGLNMQSVIDAASSSDIKKIYERNTSDAELAGVFGAPSFEVKGEIFWGDDRLEDAIRFSSIDA